MTSSIESQRRRLLRHGFIFLFMGVWLGIATRSVSSEHWATEEPSSYSALEVTRLEESGKSVPIETKFPPIINATEPFPQVVRFT